MKKRGTRLLGLLMVIFLLMSLVMIGCETAAPSPDDDANGAPESELKTLRVALNTVPLSVDPANHRHRNTQTLVRNWTDALTQQMPDGRHILDIAETITEIDPLTYEISIRQGITFHNGDPMTADDVIFSFQRMSIEGGMEGETSPRSPLTGPIESVDKIDDYNVVVNLSSPNPIQDTRWYNIEIMPKNYFEEVGIDGFLAQPIGVGPFKWVEGDFTTQVVLERYEDYYGGAPELPGDVDQIPAVDRVIFTFIPESTTRVAALLAGEVDIIQDVPFDSIQLLESNPNVKVVSTPGTNVVYMAFNTTRAPFNDIRVRQAIGHGIDYDLIINAQLLGYSGPLKGLPLLEAREGTPGYGQFGGLQPYEYDPEKAMALLEDAGVSGLTTVIDTTSEFSEQAQLVAQMLGDIGIEASVRVWDLAVLQEATKNGERDIYFGRHGNAAKAPQWIEQITGTGRPNNFALYSNPVFDELIETAIAMDDSPERNALFMEAFEIIMDELPVLTLHNPQVVEASLVHVKNFYPSATGRVTLHKVDIEQ